MFAQYVKGLRGERSQRRLAREVRFSHTAISDMEYGAVPKYPRLVAFADAMKLEGRARVDLFRLAGYAELEAPYDGGAYYAERLRELAASLGTNGPQYVRVELSRLPDRDTPKEEVDAIIEALREDIAEEIRRRRQEDKP